MPVIPWDDNGIPRQTEDRYSDMEFDEFWLRFLPGSGSGNQYLVRFLGMPEQFPTHYNNSTDPKTGDRKKIPFPDSDTVTKTKRNCTDPETTLAGKKSDKCPWCKLGYKVTIRYMVNLAYYGRKDEDGDPTIMLAELPQTAYEHIRDWYIANKDEFPGGPGAFDGKAPKFVINVKSKGQRTEYSVMPQGYPEPLPDEIKRALRKFNPEAKTIEEMCKLHDLERWSKPTYMPGDKQIEVFGKIIDQVPYKERKKQDSDDADDPFKGTNSSENSSDDLSEAEKSPSDPFAGADENALSDDKSSSEDKEETPSGSFFGFDETSNEDADGLDELLSENDNEDEGEGDGNGENKDPLDWQ